MRSLPLVYRDEHLIAVNKPSGLLVHHTALDRRETENAMHIVRDQLGQWVYPLHRLDKATSGVLLFALDEETARRMMLSFAGGKIAKTYLAVVRGFTEEAGRIEHPLREGRERMAGQKTDRDRPARESVTDYRRLATVEIPHPVGRYSTARFSFVTAAPLTGRYHQLRRHLKHIFHPVVGDTTYGDGKQNDFVRKRFQCHRLLLHAREIGFIHPYSDRRIHLHAPLDQAFGDLIDAFRWGTVPFS